MTTDGRKARGEARRRQLIEATLAVIERDGVAGLTHRAVAEQAGVSLASASYHFAGIDELAVAALLQVTQDMADALRSDEDRSLGRLARILAADAAEHRGRWVACYELYLLALRRPHLRGPALAWLDLVEATFAGVRAGPAFRALVEGICLHTLLREQPYTADEVELMLGA